MLRRLLVLTATTAALLGLAAPAWAHVSVDPSQAPKGGFTELTFRVPNEREVGTTKVEVFFPTDHPIPEVSVKPVPGWKTTVDKTKLATPIKTDEGEEVTEAVSKVTWTGGPIRPEEYENFPVSAGPFPDDTDSLVFKALQTYQNGEVVRWIQTQAPGQPEPEQPAPTLTLTAAGAEAPAAAAPAAASKSDVDAATTRGTVGLVLGALGVLLGAAALVIALRRRTAMPASTRDTGDAAAPTKLEV